jgi:hypothetical protein
MANLWRNETKKRNYILAFLMSISLLLECTESQFRISRTFCAVVELYKKRGWKGTGAGVGGVGSLHNLSHARFVTHRIQ